MVRVLARPPAGAGSANFEMGDVLSGGHSGGPGVCGLVIVTLSPFDPPKREKAEILKRARHGKKQEAERIKYGEKCRKICRDFKGLCV